MTLEERIAQYVLELRDLPPKISTQDVRARLLGMLRYPREEGVTRLSEDRALNDPLGLWGPSPGWRCWVGRHAECAPLGADEPCTCACGIGGLGHGLDQNGVRTEGCDCGHEGMGEKWHARDCAWRSTWRQTMREAAEKAAEEYDDDE